MRNFFLRAVAFSWLAVAALFPERTTAAAGEIRVLCSNGIKPVVEELVPEFERSTSHKISITYGVSASLARQIEADEPFDVAILTASLIDEAVEHLRIQRGSTSELARSPIALGMKQGRPKRAVASVEDLKRALRGAASIAYAREGASAPFFVEAMRKLGLADEIAPKIRLTENGAQAASMVARGEAELCVLPTSEILPVAGLDVLGSFPDGVKGYLVMVAGIGARSREPGAAKSFIAFLQSSAAVPVLRRKGMDAEKPPLTALSAQHLDDARVSFVPPDVDWLRAAPAELRRLESSAPDSRMTAILRTHQDDFGYAVMPFDVAVPGELKSRSYVLLDAAGASAMRVERLKGTARVSLDASPPEARFFGDAVARPIGSRRAGGGFVLVGLRVVDVTIGESRREAADLDGASALESAASIRFWTITRQYELRIAGDAATYVFVQWAPDDDVHEAGCQHRFTLFKLTPSPVVVASTDYGCDV